MKPFTWFAATAEITEDTLYLPSSGHKSGTVPLVCLHQEGPVLLGGGGGGGSSGGTALAGGLFLKYPISEKMFVLGNSIVGLFFFFNLPTLVCAGCFL